MNGRAPTSQSKSPAPRGNPFRTTFPNAPAGGHDPRRGAAGRTPAASSRRGWAPIAAFVRFVLLMRPRRPLAGWVVLGITLAGMTVAGAALVSEVERELPTQQWGPFQFEIDPHRMFDIDKAQHFALCATLAMTMFVGLHHALWMTRRRAAATVFVLVGIVFSATTEFVQGWMTHRSAQLFDLIANLAGTATGVLALLAVSALARWLIAEREPQSIFAARS